MDMFIAESQACHISDIHLRRAASLRAQIESLHSQIQRDGFVLEQLSLKTKTPYVQFTLTKRLLEGSQTGAMPSTTEGSAPGASDGAAVSTAAAGLGGVTSALSAGAAGGDTTAVASSLAADSKDPTSLPPM